MAQFLRFVHRICPCYIYNRITSLSNDNFDHRLSTFGRKMLQTCGKVQIGANLSLCVCYRLVFFHLKGFGSNLTKSEGNWRHFRPRMSRICHETGKKCVFFIWKYENNTRIKFSARNLKKIRKISKKWLKSGFFWIISAPQKCKDTRKGKKVTQNLIRFSAFWENFG